MNTKYLLSAGISAMMLFAGLEQANAAVTIGHPEPGAGAFLTSTGGAVASGGVSIGYFPSGAPLDAAFGTTITDFASLVAAGYVDVRNISGATQTSGFDWDFPQNIGGSVQNVPFASLALNTQLYVIAFNAGGYVAGTPGSPATTAGSYAGATEWAVIKDTTDHRSPADLGTKNILLNTVVGADILIGSDNGNNVNMASLSAVPEPSRALLGMVGLAALFIRRRR
jgi:MYXO-CTERM domain-containing protein